MTQLRVGQVQGGERVVFHRRVQAETWKGEPEPGKGRDRAQWEHTGACSPGRSPLGRHTLAKLGSRPTLCPARLAGSAVHFC